ncbi:helix-turn-helix transcriptional regulator [Streptomyces sp. NPDC020875]|uniref:helix-turn-helix domain-containing protein n=1 Tax=Streptomyces sp. NPDC020875 TaxID=3154898 RepID=UPI0034010A12
MPINVAWAERTLVNRKELNPDGSPEEAFGARLRSTREARGWTQDELADRMGYTGRHVSGVETGRKPPTRRFAMSADAALGLEGTSDTFERAWGEIRHGALLEGFPEYLGHESRAVEIRLFQLGVMPGLLQTPDYARAIANGDVRRGTIEPEKAEERVAVLADRQAALVRTRPPTMLVVMDESCLRHSIGGPKVMQAQLDRLLDFAEQPNTVLQIAPYALGERRPFVLPVNLLTMADRTMMAYAESQLQGHFERQPTVVLPLLAAYHQLQAEALPQAASIDMIHQVRRGSP